MIFGMKDFRKLLPHRSNSLIQDWVTNKIFLVSQKHESGAPYETKDPYELIDLLVVDQFSALGMFSKPYQGVNRPPTTSKDGNIWEIFSYVPDDTPPEVADPAIRSRSNAIEFYRKWRGRVIIAISLIRTRSVSRSKAKTEFGKSRSKQGLLYYSLDYFRSTTDRVDEEISVWKQGNAAYHGPTLCLISVELLKQQIELTLDVPRYEWEEWE
jgi:hypothetical protein